MKPIVLCTLILAVAACAGTDRRPLADNHPAHPDAKQAPDGPNSTQLVIADTPRAGGERPKAIPYPLQVCLVGGEDLGSMGKPVSFVYEGREIKLCCKGCEPEFRAEPQKFLKKLDAAAKAPPAKPATPAKPAADHEHDHH
jgi:hypothetical protein